MYVFKLVAVAMLAIAGTTPPGAASEHDAALPGRLVPDDTTTRIRFDISSAPLVQALRDYSSQSGIQVQVDLSAIASERSQPLIGSYRAAEGLRILLAGTSLRGHFVDRERVVIARNPEEELFAHTLTPLTVFGSNRRAYAGTRTTTATKTDTPLRDTPQSISVVTRRVISDQGMSGMAEVVRYVPGVTMGQGEGHRDAPTIRGNSSTADFFLDGMRDDAQYFRDLYNVERVEALKGSNAMIFGRGGGGGVINRVSKEAGWSPTRELTFAGGSFDHRRATLDLGQGFGAGFAARLNGLYENSGGFRDGAEVQRRGINPTIALALGLRTTVRAGYEYYEDDRRIDRGIPSHQGRPSSADIATFFGNPALSEGDIAVQSANAFIEHASARGVTLRNRTRWADYDKFYQNSYAGSSLNAAGTHVSLSAYNQALGRTNLLNQTDLTYETRTGSLGHTFLLGAELGRQESSNTRETGYYHDSATSLLVPFGQPTVTAPITFRQSATDADNETTASVVSVYAQDQVAISSVLEAVVGVRWDRFTIAYRNHRKVENLQRTDELISPRVGLVLKPVASASLYGTYSVSYLPSAGDQFASLTATTQTLEPEQFTNYEVGAKWDVRPSLSLAAAAYRLDRTNTSAPDPNDAALLVQTGSQRTRGIELGASGSLTEKLQIVGGAAWQEAEIVSATTAAKAGAKVALVPERTLSLWTRYQLLSPLGIGIGIIDQSDMFAAIDNSVTLPGFTRVDGALFVRVGPGLSAQLNVENLFDERYYPTSHGNNNIMPGASRSLRISVVATP